MATEYSDEIASTICQRMAEGESLRQVCGSPGMPTRQTVYKWIEKNAAFADNYARAREAMFDFWADQIREIAFDGSGDIIVENGKTKVDHENVNRSRLKVDALKWILSKLAPRRFGENPVDDDEVKPALHTIRRIIIGWEKNDPKDKPPEPPKQLTYQPAPPPADLPPEDWRAILRVLDAIKQHSGGGDTPQAAEVFGVIEEALQARFGSKAINGK